MTASRVLVVDDNPTNLKLTRIVLSEEGFEVQTSADAEGALRVLDAFQPDVILMDIQLPGMDGLELTRRLKADPSRRHIAIVALTAYAMKGDFEKAIAAGCDAYVSKPIDTEALPKVVAECVERARAALPRAPA